MIYTRRGIQFIAFCWISVILLLAVAWQGDASAESECYLKCFTTEEDARVCVVEGHRLYEQIEVRTENGDQCLSSIKQARTAGFMVLGAPETKPGAAQPAPRVIPAEPVEEIEEAPEPAPEPEAATEVVEPEQTAEAVAPEGEELPQESVEEQQPEEAIEAQPEETVTENADEAPSTSVPDAVAPLSDGEKILLVATLIDQSISLEERRRIYQQLITIPNLTEKEREDIEFAWQLSSREDLKTLALIFLKKILRGDANVTIGGMNGLVALIISLVGSVFFVVCGWIIFAKADVPGWLSLIPIVNIFFVVKISGKPVWWFFLMPFFLPLFILWPLTCFALAKRFGKGFFVGLLLLFVPLIGMPILAFSGEYEG